MTKKILLTGQTFYRASRESKELLAESKQLAFSLNAWIRDVLKQPVKVKKQLGFVPAYGSLCGTLGLTKQKYSRLIPLPF